VILGELGEGLLVSGSFDERQCGDVVDSRDDCIPKRSRKFLGFVLGARATDDRGRGPDETNARGFDRFDEIGIFGHEAVTREDMRVAVLLGDLDDLSNAFELLFLARAHVVHHTMDVAGEGEVS